MSVTETVKEDLKQLIQMKEAIEIEIKQLHDYLQSCGTNMTDPLVNSEGYPRADIDVFGVRTTRNKIICLGNDLKQIMKEIEVGLHRVHESARNAGEYDGSAMQQNSAPKELSERRISNTPFLTVNSVTGGSPAADAGLLKGDEIIQFGSICEPNFKALNQIGDLVQNSVNKPIRVTVLRENHAVHLSLVPKQWSGQGFLGCHIVPFRSQ